MKREDPNETIAKIRARAAEDEAKVLKNETLLGLMPEWALEYNHNSPFWHQLYGHEVSIRWSANLYYSLAGGIAPDLEFAQRLMAEYPPLPMVLVEDGCKSFRQATVAERGKITPISPFFVRIDLNDARRALITWESMIGEFCAQLSVAVPIPQWFGYANVEYKTWREFRKVERCDFTANVPGARVIKWARGSNEYCNDFTVYWLDPEYTLADMMSNAPTKVPNE